MEWEIVNRTETIDLLSRTERLEVPTGWLYRTIVFFDGNIHLAMTFVPFEEDL